MSLRIDLLYSILCGVLGVVLGHREVFFSLQCCGSISAVWEVSGCHRWFNFQFSSSGTLDASRQKRWLLVSRSDVIHWQAEAGGHCRWAEWEIKDALSAALCMFMPHSYIMMSGHPTCNYCNNCKSAGWNSDFSLQLKWIGNSLKPQNQNMSIWCTKLMKRRNQAGLRRFLENSLLIIIDRLLNPPNLTAHLFYSPPSHIMCHVLNPFSISPAELHPYLCTGLDITSPLFPF